MNVDGGDVNVNDGDDIINGVKIVSGDVIKEVKVVKEVDNTNNSQTMVRDHYFLSFF